MSGKKRVILSFDSPDFFGGCEVGSFLRTTQVWGRNVRTGHGRSLDPLVPRWEVFVSTRPGSRFGSRWRTIATSREYLGVKGGDLLPHWSLTTSLPPDTEAVRPRVLPPSNQVGPTTTREVQRVCRPGAATTRGDPPTSLPTPFTHPPVPTTLLLPPPQTPTYLPSDPPTYPFTTYGRTGERTGGRWWSQKTKQNPPQETRS